MIIASGPQPASILSARFLGAYLVTMRPYLLFVSGVTGIVGLSLAPDLPSITALLLAIPFFFSYGFGQALTDCFQIDTDRLSSPYRPLVQGVVRRSDVMIVSLLGLAIIGVALGLRDIGSVPLAVLGAGGLTTYTFFKRLWGGGPFYNAWIVAVLCLIGYRCGVGPSADWAPTLPVAGTLATIFFGYANFVLTGYYKDIGADRATGYRTMPVVMGLRISTIVSDVLAFLEILAWSVVIGWSLVTAHSAGGSWFFLPYGCAGLVMAVVAQIRLHRVVGERDAHKAVAPVVHAYILLLAALAVALKPAWALPLAAFYGAFVATMCLRPMREQI